MGEKKSNFTALTSVADASTFDFVSNGQNFKITKADLLAALGVTGTLSQEGAVTGTPVLDISATPNYAIRNLEALDGVSVAVSPENGVSVGADLVAGTNVSIVPNGAGALTISASIGSAANTVIVQSKSDFPTPSSGVITLAVASYEIKGNIDLGSDVIVMVGGSQIVGDTVTLSSITTSNASPTITASSGAFSACSIFGRGGIKINNTGGGAAVRVQDTGTICAIRRLFTNNCGTALEINDGAVLLDSWTVTGTAVNGIVMTGTSNTGPIINNFNPLGLTGKGIYINGDITSGALRINDAIIGSTASPIADHGVEIASGVTIQGMSFSGDSISNTGNGMKIAGNVDGGISLDKTNILSFTNDGMDITDGRFSSYIADAVGITGIAASKYGLVGNAEASGSITAQADSATNPGVDTTITIGAHSFTNGTPVSISGTTSYNGHFRMTAVTATTFDIAVAFVSDEGVGDYTISNITTGAGIVSSSFIDGLGAGGGALSGIDKKDLRWSFTSAGPKIVDSTDLGGFTLDTQFSTPIAYQGFDGANTAYADSATSPGVKTTVTSVGHSIVNGAPVSITGTTNYNRLSTASNVTANTYDIDMVFVADDATGNYQSGWTKVLGGTTPIESVERFSEVNDNEIISLDSKDISVVYTATISGEKSGSTPRLCQLALFVDFGSGFEKVDGEATLDVTNRIKSSTLRIPFVISEGAICTLYCRNTEGTETFIADALGVDIGKA